MAKAKANKNIASSIKRILWIVFFFIAAALIVSAVEKKKSKVAKDILINIKTMSDGNTLINSEDVRVTIERSFGHDLAGVPLGELDVARVERVLEEDGFINNADVYVDAENKIHIEVNQREPILRIIDNNGLNYYLDKEGVKMPTSDHFTARVLVATGNIPPHVPDFKERKKHVIKDLFELTNKLRQDGFLDAMIEQIHITDNKEYILIPKVGKQKILLGPYEEIDEKFKRLKIFYKEGIPYEGWKKYKTINLKFKDQVVCKKR